MNTITLHLSPLEDPQLLEVVFTSEIESVRHHSVRGKTCGALGTGRAFQWTSAVKALVVLFINAKLDTKDDQMRTTLGLLSGEKGSLAASLDYALSKQPNWIGEMFGVSANGDCYLRKLLVRTNPERKYAGPVILGIRRNKLSRENIHILINQKECDPATLSIITRILGESSYNNLASDISQYAPQNLSPLVKSTTDSESQVWDK